MRAKRLGVLALTLVLAGGGTQALAAEAPHNDHAEGAVQLAVPGAYEQRTDLATSDEDSSSGCGTPRRSVWFKVPPQPASVRVVATSYDAEVMVEAFSGSPADLTPIVCASPGTVSPVDVGPLEGWTYIRVSHPWGGYGLIRVAVEERTVPVPVSSLPFSTAGNMRLVGSTNSECRYDWQSPTYVYTPAQDETLRIKYSAELAWGLGISILEDSTRKFCDYDYVYGDEWSYPQPIDRQSIVSLTQGRTYAITLSIDEWDYTDASGFALEMVRLEPPANDSIEGAFDIGAPAETVASTLGATRSTGEPLRCGADRSVWFKVEPDRDGQVMLGTEGSDFDTVLAVYTRSAGGALTQVACNDDKGAAKDSLVAFDTKAGETYYVQAGGFMGEMGELHLTADHSTWVSQSLTLAGSYEAGKRGDYLGACVTSRFVPSACVFAPVPRT